MFLSSFHQFSLMYTDYIHNIKADTMVLLKDMSTDDANYSAVLNAFIGNGEFTQKFISTILFYLYADYIDTENNSAVYDALMTTTIIKYIIEHVKPQLKTVLETKKICMEKNEDHNIYTIDDFNTVQQMIDDCYAKKEK